MILIITNVFLPTDILVFNLDWYSYDYIFVWVYKDEAPQHSNQYETHYACKSRYDHTSVPFFYVKLWKIILHFYLDKVNYLDINMYVAFTLLKLLKLFIGIIRSSFLFLFWILKKLFFFLYLETFKCNLFTDVYVVFVSICFNIYVSISISQKSEDKIYM